MSASTLTVGQTVTFTDTSIEGSGTITSMVLELWQWIYTSNQHTIKPQHVSYSTTGSKIVSLTVTDTNGKTSTTTQSLVVSDYASPTASFTWIPLTI